MRTQPGLHRPTRRLRVVLVVLATLLPALGWASPAAAETAAESLVVRGEVAADGMLRLTQTFTFGASGAPDRLIQRLATSRPGMAYTQLDYEITDVAVRSAGADLEHQVSMAGDYLVITANTSRVAGEPVEISYRVSGAALAMPEVAGQEPMTQIDWRVVQGLNIAVKRVSGEIRIPPGAQTTDITCQAGAPTAPMSCSTYGSGTFESPFPRFTNDALGAGGMVALTFTVASSDIAPNQVITEQWTLGRAFSVGPLQLVVALGALLVGAAMLYWLLRSRGRDAAGGEPVMVAHFEPVAAGEERLDMDLNIRPGEVGTLMDERVDPVDITATIIDLAQRGHLTIVELPRSGPHDRQDWLLERRRGGDDELQAYETTLLDAIAPADRPGIRVSEIGDPVREVIPKVQDEIYAEVVQEGWFATRPDSVRDRWGRLGAGAVVASLVALGLLVAFTRFGLLGLALVLLAVGLVQVGQQMPRRTARGAAVLRGLEVFSMNLQTHPTTKLPKQDAYTEISRVLPYTVVLGGLQRWLAALVAADNDPGMPDPDDLDWYRAPDTWQLSDLPASLDALITTLEGKLYQRG